MSKNFSDNLLILGLMAGGLVIHFGHRDNSDFKGKFLQRGSADGVSLVARWTPNPDRGSADSTLSGGRR